MRAYKEYKDSGYDWMGKIPAHWRCVKIREIFIERRNKVSDKDFPPLSVTKAGIVPQLETAAKSDDGDNRKRVNVGDFVINGRSDRKGSSGISPLEGSVSLINHVLIPRLGVNKAFLHYLLRSNFFIEEFYKNGRGIVADLWTTRYSDMKTIRLPLPPREEQDAIVRFLDAKCAKIDSLIKLKERQIALLNEKKQSIINQAVTRGLDPNAPMKDSGVDWIGEIPEGWEVSKLKYMGVIQTGVTLGKDYSKEATSEYPYLCVANVQDGYIDLKKIKFINLPPKEAQRYFLQKGDILMTEGGDPDKLGRGSVWNNEIEHCLHQNHIFAVRLNTKKVLIEFFKFILQSRYCKEYFLLSAKQTTNLASTNKTTLSNLCISIPSIIEQYKIVYQLSRVTDVFQRQIKIIEYEINTIHEYKTRIIFDVVTGKRDVFL